MATPETPEQRKTRQVAAMRDYFANRPANTLLPVQDWTADARVPAILESIRRDPPRIVGKIDALFGRWPFDDNRPDYCEYGGEHADALNGICDEYFLRAESDGGRDAALRFHAAAPRVQSVIAAAQAGASFYR